MSLEKILEKGELLDFYGKLLTQRQRECLELYYNKNLTLAEIADYFHISRQAVHDAMRHGEEQLSLYEETLHLAGDAWKSGSGTGSTSSRRGERKSSTVPESINRLR